MRHVHAHSTHRPPIDHLFAALFGRREASPVARTHRFGHDDAAETETGDDVLAEFRAQARDLHERIVHEHGVFVAEFLGATGSGKTTLVERLIERAPADERIGVIVGDVAGDDDASRYRDHGVAVTNVTTGKECHLDPGLIEDALADFDLHALDTLYVENVGNMVCPADFPLGAQLRVLVVSTTEGDDVVRKHPLLFQACDAAVVNKADLADAVGADIDRMAADVADVAPGMDLFRTSARDGDGVEPLASFLDGVRAGGHDHHGHPHGADEHLG